ncbi:MAG: hypothetical protein JSS32_07090 [Verrucomicrobia bacterium]|nr:hypothetical protein [Verrucomicrobiota bacterium]
MLTMIVSSSPNFHPLTSISTATDDPGQATVAQATNDLNESIAENASAIQTIQNLIDQAKNNGADPILIKALQLQLDQAGAALNQAETQLTDANQYLPTYETAFANYNANPTSSNKQALDAAFATLTGYTSAVESDIPQYNATVKISVNNANTIFPFSQSNSGMSAIQDSGNALKEINLQIKQLQFILSKAQTAHMDPSAIALIQNQLTAAESAATDTQNQISNEQGALETYYSAFVTNVENPTPSNAQAVVQALSALDALDNAAQKDLNTAMNSIGTSAAQSDYNNAASTDNTMNSSLSNLQQMYAFAQQNGAGQAILNLMQSLSITTSSLSADGSTKLSQIQNFLTSYQQAVDNYIQDPANPLAKKAYEDATATMQGYTNGISQDATSAASAVTQVKTSVLNGSASYYLSQISELILDIPRGTTPAAQLATLNQIYQDYAKMTDPNTMLPYMVADSSFLQELVPLKAALDAMNTSLQQGSLVTNAQINAAFAPLQNLGYSLNLPSYFNW